MTAEIEALLRKARRCLVSARRHVDEGDHDFAVSRAYYAMFYAAVALLLSRGRRYSRHTGLIDGLHREFVRGGELDRAHVAAFEAAFRARSRADYIVQESTPPETAERVLRDAEALVAVIETKLGE